MRLGLYTMIAALLATPSLAQLRIVAAENFYGDVAQQLAGANATVTSILSNPDQDPHLFEASPSVARELSAATIVVYNGADYDPWMAKLLSATRSPNRKVIIVANLVHRKAGDNPHLWYDPATMPAYANALTAALLRTRPGARSGLRAAPERVPGLAAADAERRSPTCVRSSPARRSPRPSRSSATWPPPLD